MQKIKKVFHFNQPWVQYLLLALVLAVVLPLLFGVLHISKPWRIGVLFFVANGLASLISGYLVQQKGQPKYVLLFLPILFAVMVVVRFADYSYWFIPVYLLLSYIGMNTARSRQ